MLINAGVKRIVYEGEYADQLALDMLEEAGLELVRFEPRPTARSEVNER
jgi:dCMP deaminase